MYLKDLQAIFDLAIDLAIAQAADLALLSAPSAPVWFSHLVTFTFSEFGFALLQTFGLGTFFGVVAASVSATIARVRYRRSAWALVYSSAGALLFWLGAIGFAWQESSSANYPLFREVYGSGSREHIVAIREASKVLTLLMFAPAIGASIGVMLTPKTLRKRKSKVVLGTKGVE